MKSQISYWITLFKIINRRFNNFIPPYLFWINTSSRVKFFDKFLSNLSKKGVGFYTLRDINICYNSFKSNWF